MNYIYGNVSYNNVIIFFFKRNHPCRNHEMLVSSDIYKIINPLYF